MHIGPRRSTAQSDNGLGLSVFQSSNGALALTIAGALAGIV
jgi:hypothetical protein